MTGAKADCHATEARDDVIQCRSLYPATRAQAQKRLAMTRLGADFHTLLRGRVNCTRAGLGALSMM